LATQLNSAKFQQGFLPHRLQVVEIWPDLNAALEAPAKEQPQVLMVHVRSLHALVQAALQRLIQKTGARQVMVTYHFGQEQAAQSLRQSGVLLRRGPISTHELPDLFRSAMVLDSPAAEKAYPTAPGIIGPRKFEDATLARVAAISTDVLCECPRHVSEIITQLVSFEQYSDECLSKSAEDSQLHAYLHSVAGSARVLFEAALAAANGLKFEDALASITIDAAKIIGVDKRVGSLEAGKDGDVAMYDGDPFEYTSHCVGTVIEGKVVSEKAH